MVETSGFETPHQLLGMGLLVYRLYSTVGIVPSHRTGSAGYSGGTWQGVVLRRWENMRMSGSPAPGPLWGRGKTFGC